MHTRLRQQGFLMRTESERSSVLQPVTVIESRQLLNVAFNLPRPLLLTSRRDMLLEEALPEAVPVPSGPCQSPLTLLPENVSDVENVKLLAVLAQLKSWLSDFSPPDALPWHRMRSLFPLASFSVPEPAHWPLSVSIALACAAETSPDMERSVAAASRRRCFGIAIFFPVRAR